MLRSQESLAIFAVSLSAHQVDVIETASCECVQGPSAAEALARAFGARLESIDLELSGQKPAARLGVAQDRGERLAVELPVIEALALALRHGLPIMLRTAVGAEGVEGCALSSPVRSFIEALDLSDL
jgi:hypothetical protein